MKKIFISILSVAMFAACAKSETEEIAPIAPEPEDEAQTVYVEIGATTGSETKATYDENLKAYWEAGDQILAVQGHACDWKAGGNDKTVYANNLNLQSGDYTNSAVFAGNISTQTSNAKYFHFAYPATNTVLSTHGNINAFNTSNTQTATCTYTVPTEQDGKWTPFLCASTTEKTTATAITGIDFGTSLNACFAVRVFENDKTTPKKIKSITITAENNIAGTISATTANDGAFSADMFTCNGVGNTVTADNLQNIETLGGLYEYRFEVLPVEAGVLTLTVTDEAGSVITRQTSAKTFRANARGGVNVYWDEAIILMDTPLSWYEDTTKDHLSTLAPKSIYAQNVNISGVGIDGITEVGIYVNGEKKPNDNKALQFDKQVVVPESGEYIVEPYAILANGTEIKGAGQTVIVTDKLDILSHNISSSYNSNGTVSKTNDIEGDKIKASYLINDSYANANLIKSIRFVSDEISADMEADKEFTSAALDPQAYNNCHIVIEFQNGYVINTPAYTINVTGVPYSINFTNGNPTNWSTNNTDKSSLGNWLKLNTGTAWIISPRFIVPEYCDVIATINAGAYASAGTYKPNIYISASSSGEQGGEATQLTGRTAAFVSYYDISRDIQIGTEENNSHICIYSTGDKPWSATSNAGITVKTFLIKYNI